MTVHQSGIDDLSELIMSHSNYSLLQIELACWLSPSKMLTPDKLRDKYRKPNSANYAQDKYGDEVTHMEVLAICGVLYAHSVIEFENIEKIFDRPPFLQCPLVETDWQFLQEGYEVWKKEFGKETETKEYRDISSRPKYNLSWYWMIFIAIILLLVIFGFFQRGGGPILPLIMLIGFSQTKIIFISSFVENLKHPFTLKQLI